MHCSPRFVQGPAVPYCCRFMPFPPAHHSPRFVGVAIAPSHPRSVPRLIASSHARSVRGPPACYPFGFYSALDRPHSCVAPFTRPRISLFAPPVRGCPPSLRSPPLSCAALSESPPLFCLRSYLSLVISWTAPPRSKPSTPCTLFSAQAGHGLAHPYPCRHALPSLIPCTALPQPSPSRFLRHGRYMAHLVSYVTY